MVHLSSRSPNLVTVQIIIVNQRELLGKAEDLAELFRPQGWFVVVHCNVKEGVDHFRHTPPNLVLLLAEVPTKECFDLCRRLNKLSASNHIPVVFYSPSNRSSHKIRAYSSGAADYWVAIAETEEIIHRAITHLALQQSQREVGRLQLELDRLSRVDSQVRNSIDDSQDPFESPEISSNAYLAEAIAAFNEVIITLAGSAQEIILISPSAQKMFGFSTAEFLSQPSLWKQVIHSEDLAKVDLALQRLMETPQEEVEYRFFRKDNVMRWARACLYRVFQNNKIVRIHALVSDVTERKQAEEQLRRRALLDVLTEIPNRTLFIQQLEKALGQTLRSPDYQFAVMLVDLNQFKLVNDTFGHLTGDKLLVKVAKILENCIRPVDMACRFGGDEFTLFLDNIEDIAYATQIAERVLEALSEPVSINGFSLRVNASIGIAIGNRMYQQVSDLLQDADTAMYRAKRRQQGAYDFFFGRRTDNGFKSQVVDTSRGVKIRSGKTLFAQKPVLV